MSPRHRNQPALRRRVLGALAACVLLLAACSSSSSVDGPGSAADREGADQPASGREGGAGTGSEGDDVDPGDDTAGDEAGNDPDSDAGGDDPTVPGEPRVVPPLVLPNSAPGSDEAAQALLADLDRFITDEQRADGVPWPDLRNPDPVAVYRSDAAFQQWMSENNPTPSLVEAYTAPNSPERGWDLELFDYLNSLDLRSGPADPPYSMRVEGVVHPAATGITDALLAQVPQGSAAVVYWDSVGTRDTFTADGQFFSRDTGWTDVGPWVAIMAPTDVGWQVWWDELTEPPPPGSRLDRGAPDDEDPRRDV